MLYCPVCVPLDVGILLCVLRPISPAQCRQGYNEHDSLCNSYFLCSILPSELRLSREDLHGPPPLYHCDCLIVPQHYSLVIHRHTVTVGNELTKSRRKMWYAHECSTSVVMCVPLG